MEFLRATDEQLATNEWRSYTLTMAVRKRLSAELVRRVMFLQAQSGGSEAAIQDTGSCDALMQTIFTAMDTDNSNSLRSVPERSLYTAQCVYIQRYGGAPLMRACVALHRCCSMSELRGGLIRYGIRMAESDLAVISDYITKEGMQQEDSHELSVKQVSKQ